MNTGVKLHDLYEKTTAWWLQHALYDPAVVFCVEVVFIEAYCIRGGLTRLKFLEAGDGRSDAHRAADEFSAIQPLMQDTLTDAIVRRDLGPLDPLDDERQRLEEGAFAFCDRVVSHQGVQGPPEALFMGYGLRVVGGVVEHSCVADQAAVANAVLDTLTAYPEHPRASVWLGCIERWAGWVIREFATPSGGIGVGLLSHKWNPIPEYWCATSLFAASLFKLAARTGKDEYVQPALRALDWLSHFDYENVTIPTFNECAPEVILYASEGIVEGVRFLGETQGLDAARKHPAVDKFRDMARWLVENQYSNGQWPEPVSRGYRDYSLGIPWLLLQMDQLVGGDRWVECAERCLGSILQPDGERYYGMYTRPWTTGLAWLSLGQWAMATRMERVTSTALAT